MNRELCQDANTVELMAFVRYVSAMSRLGFPVLGAVLLPLIFVVGCGQNTQQITVERLESFEPYAPSDYMQQIYDLNVEQAVSLIERNPDVAIIDIRGIDAFNKSRMPKALSYDRSFEGFRDEMSVFERDQPILVYGSNTPESGAKTSNAIEDLKELGFVSIYFLNFSIGIEGWAEAGNEVERGY